MKGRADVHVHTKYSGLTRVEFIKVPDSVSEPKDIVKVAEGKGLSVLCVTDHNNLRGALKAKALASKVEVVIGEEIVTSEGEVLGLFLQEEVPTGLSAAEAIERIHAQGGLAVAPHPFSPRCKSLGSAVSKLDLDGIEVLNSMHIDGYSNSFARQVFSGSEVAKVGGSDAHHHYMVGNAFTTFDGTTAEELRNAIRRGTTDVGGAQTPLRQIMWMISNLTARVDYALFRSLLGLDIKDDAQWVELVSSMRLSTRMMCMVGSTALLAPPVLVMGVLVGAAVHGTRSRSSLRVVEDDLVAAVSSVGK